MLVLLVTGVLGEYALEIRLDSSVENLLPKNDPDTQYYADVRRVFGSDEIGVIGLIADDIYTPPVLQKIKRLTDEIARLPEVRKVISLTNAPDVIKSIARESTLLVPDVNASPEALATIKRTVADHPIYLKNLVSADGRAAAINIILADLDDDEFFRRGVDATIEALIAKEQGPEALHYTGLPHFKTYSTRAMWRDLTLFMPIILMLIVGVLYVIFRSIRGVVIPSLTVLVSLTWTLGIMVLAGSSLSLGSMALPPLILVLGTAYSLHIVAEYYELARPGCTPEEVVLETLRATGGPLFVATLTTVFGFLSLILNRVVSIRELGIYASIGISIAFLLAMILGPALLALLPLPARRGGGLSPRVNASLCWLARLSTRHHRAVIAVSFVVAVISAWQSSFIQIGSDFQSFFRKSDPIRQATEAINRHLVGSMTFYVIVDGHEKGAIKTFDALWRIKKLQGYIDSLPGVEKTISFVDYCEIIDRGIQEIPPVPSELSGGNGEPVPGSPTTAKTTFWEDRDQLKGVLRLAYLNSDSVAAVVDHPRYSRTAILVRTSLSRSRDINQLVNEIGSYADDHFPPELGVHTSGNLVLLTRTAGDILSGQIQSLALTAGVIFLLMSVMFLSVRVGLIAMVPNVFPVIVFFGLMGVTGSELNFGTNIIASIALGVAVDDTIHIMTRLGSLVRTVPDQERALEETLSTVGRASLFASLVLLLGFFILCFSTFVPIQEFGFLSGVTMLVGVVAEIALLPAMLAITPVITLWDLLHVGLGKDPEKTIPLFAGLRPFQAKIVALMGTLKSFPSGHSIIRRGEASDEMYVVIRGRAELRVTSGNRSRVAWDVSRGDVFGVTSLLANGDRISDVIAVEEIEVLAMDGKFRTRIWRYPRIAARVFFNLSTILVDRVQNRLLPVVADESDREGRSPRRGMGEEESCA